MKNIERFISLPRFALALTTVIAATSAPSASAELPADYLGKPFGDAQHESAPQRIPGTIQCAFYDTGGEGVAYHDTDGRNSGSGKLNPANGTYLNEFRIKEAVDTSYTKYHDDIDRHPFNKVQPAEGMLYVGWTEPGEWFNVTVDVAEKGTYTADLLYTAALEGEISVDVNFKPATSPINLPTTFDAAEPIRWRNWHHWNLAKAVVTLDLEKGLNVLTVHIAAKGNLNLCTLEFRPKA